MMKSNVLKTDIESKLDLCLKSYNVDYIREFLPGDEKELDTIKFTTNNFVIWIGNDTLELIDNYDKKKEIHREIWDYKSKNEKEMVDDFVRRVENYLKSNPN